MTISSRAKVQFITVGFLLLAVFSTVGPLARAQTPVIGSPSLQQDSLTFTVNPDQSVGVGWTTAASLGAGSGIQLTGGYKIHSSSNFTQEANAVVENTTVQYQLPSALTSYVSSISLTASQIGLTGTGALSITTGLPVQSLNIGYKTTPSQIEVNATAQIQLGCQLCLSIPPFANQSSFDQLWTKTLGNSSWVSNNIVYPLQNSTMHALVVSFNANRVFNPPTGATSVRVSIGFVAIASGASGTDFITAFENALFRGSTPPALDSIVRATMALSTGESATASYNSQTGLLIIKVNSSFVSNLDSQLNSIKGQFFRFLFNIQPAGSITPSETFLNATTVTVSKITETSDYDLSASKFTSTFSGLVLNPPTEGTNSLFTIHGLFQTLGSVPMSTPGLNITLTGGSDSKNQVKIIVPTGTPPANNTSSNSATWYNVRNATELQNVQFQLQALPSSIFTFLTSPTGIAIEAVVAAAIIASAVILARRKRAKMPTPIAPSGPATAPGMGPSPAPPAPSQ